MPEQSVAAGCVFLFNKLTAWCYRGLNVDLDCMLQQYTHIQIGLRAVNRYRSTSVILIMQDVRCSPVTSVLLQKEPFSMHHDLRQRCFYNDDFMFHVAIHFDTFMNFRIQYYASLRVLLLWACLNY